MKIRLLSIFSVRFLLFTQRHKLFIIKLFQIDTDALK